MKPYKIFRNQKIYLRKSRIIPPIKRIKVPLYFCKYLGTLQKKEIILPTQGDS
jgi:hypothetical protein